MFVEAETSRYHRALRDGVVITHDSLCPQKPEQEMTHQCFYCDLISKVREDERTRLRRYRDEQGHTIMQRNPGSN